MTVDRGRRARSTPSTTRPRSCAPRASTPCTAPSSTSPTTSRSPTLAAAVHADARRGPRAVQQRGRRLGRRRVHLGARARRLAVGLRRQRVGRDPRHQGVRAAHGRERRTRSRREHVVGERRRRPVRRHRGVRDDEGRGRDDHRVAVRAPAPRRVRRCARRCCSPARTGCARISGRRGGGGPTSTRRRAPPDAVSVARPARADDERSRRRARMDTARRSRRHRGARHPGRAVLDAAAERHDRRVDPGARRVDARPRESRPTSASGSRKRTHGRAQESQ